MRTTPYVSSRHVNRWSALDNVRGLPGRQYATVEHRAGIYAAIIATDYDATSTCTESCRAFNAIRKASSPLLIASFNCSAHNLTGVRADDNTWSAATIQTAPTYTSTYTPTPT
eukprot:scpid59928/ scgid8559/ 